MTLLQSILPHHIARGPASVQAAPTKPALPSAPFETAKTSYLNGSGKYFGHVAGGQGTKVRWAARGFNDFNALTDWLGRQSPVRMGLSFGAGLAVLTLGGFLLTLGTTYDEHAGLWYDETFMGDEHAAELNAELAQLQNMGATGEMSPEILALARRIGDSGDITALTLLTARLHDPAFTPR